MAAAHAESAFGSSLRESSNPAGCQRPGSVGPRACDASPVGFEQQKRDMWAKLSTEDDGVCVTRFCTENQANIILCHRLE